MGKLYVGTSGWVYGDWNGIFYPENLSSKDRLRYFSQHFKTAEINYSFYHLPKPETYKNWYNQTPADFVFAVKASRYITHVKRLKGVKTAWKRFLGNALHLREKLGPILFQFPPSLKVTPENTKRLGDFLEFIIGPSLRIAFEFRHRSWCDEKAYETLRKHKIAWVISDSSRYPKAEAVTSDFVYIRMHGPKSLFSSKYTDEELKTLAQKIKNWLSKGLDVYAYFNNDFQGYAIQDAKEILRLLAEYKEV
ncbi:MAG TPA: DUF72 domain-containing protein [Thermodesulfobacteriota bacterium]|nr:DUF72 domain-containing protein [Thermodesulfobacteriota bacterium]